MIPATNQNMNVKADINLAKTVALAIFSLAAIGAVYFIYRKFRGGFLAIGSKISESDVVKAAKNTLDSSNLTYDKLSYESWADSLFQAMVGSGTSENTILNVFEKMKNDDDIKYLIFCFGTRTGKPSFVSKSLTGNLSSWLTTELSASLISKINKGFSERGISFAF